MRFEPAVAAIILIVGVAWRNYASVTSTAALALSIYTLLVTQHELREARKAALREIRKTGG